MHAGMATFLYDGVALVLIQTCACAPSSPHCPGQCTPMHIPAKWNAFLAVSLILSAAWQAVGVSASTFMFNWRRLV